MYFMLMILSSLRCLLFRDISIFFSNFQHCLGYLMLGNTYFEYDGIPEGIGRLENLSKFVAFTDDTSISLFDFIVLTCLSLYATFCHHSQNAQSNSIVHIPCSVDRFKVAFSRTSHSFVSEVVTTHWFVILL